MTAARKRAIDPAEAVMRSCGAEFPLDALRAMIASMEELQKAGLSAVHIDALKERGNG